MTSTVSSKVLCMEQLINAFLPGPYNVQCKLHIEAWQYCPFLRPFDMHHHVDVNIQKPRRFKHNTVNVLTFFEPESVMLRKFFARLLSKKNLESSVPLTSLRLRIPRTSRHLQCRLIDAHDWSVSVRQLEMSMSIRVPPRACVSCME